MWSTTELMQSYSLLSYFQQEAAHSVVSPLPKHTHTLQLQAFIYGFTLPFSIKTNQVNRQWETYREKRKGKKKSKQA